MKLILSLAVLCLVFPATADPLCIDGHPAPRSKNLTYGGLAPHRGYERDHYIPLCLGGQDTLDNMRYQQYPAARHKDEEERRLCELMCAGKITQEIAIEKLMNDWTGP
jgi:hypothetical protein